MVFISLLTIKIHSRAVDAGVQMGSVQVMCLVT